MWCNRVMRIAVVGAELEENLAVRYIRAALAAEGHEVFQVSFSAAADVEPAAQALAAGAPDIVAMSLVFTARAREFLALAAWARMLGYAGHIVVGGHFAALNAADLLRDAPAIDSVGLGEGEAIVCDLARNLGDRARVPGLVWRGTDGSIVRNLAKAEPADLARLPWPVRRCPPDAYLGLPIVNMLSSRGCSHACAFCSIVAWHRFCGGPRHRTREVDDVADEMAALYTDGVRIFNFHDDNFLLRDRGAALARVLALREALAARNLGRIAFAIKARPDEVNAKLFGLLQSMGLFRVFLGVEAGTVASLRALGRGQTLDANERAIDVVNRLGLHACFNLLLCNPDSTLEDMAANVAFLRRRPDNPMNFCRTEIYAGTPLEQKLRREGRLLGDYFGYDYHIADPRADLACNLMYDVFRSRNYGDCLHHKVMSVDYESTLLNHFYPQPKSLHLTARTKAFVRRANLNTCGYLDEVVAKAADGLDAARYPEVVAEIGQRMRGDEARLLREANLLLGQIRSLAAAAKPTRPASRSRSMVAAAGLAASMAVSTFARADLAPPPSGASQAPPQATSIQPSKPDWHMVEMAPARATPAPEPVQPQNREAPKSAPENNLRNKIAKGVLKAAVRRLQDPVALRLQVTLDKKGRVVHVKVETPEEQAKKIETAIRRLSFDSQGRLAGQSISLAYTVEEVRAQLDLTPKKGSKPARTHHSEMAPPRTHMNEEVPDWRRE